MAEPIKIDLRDLTPEKLAECKPHLGECTYAAPCVIGTLMSPSERSRHSNCSIAFYPDVKLLAEQEGDVVAIQDAFDGGDWGRVKRIAAKYMTTPTDSGETS